MSNQEITIQRINSAYGEFCVLGAKAKQLQIDGANKAREVGLLLLEFKKHCPHGEFTQAFASFHGKVVTDYKFAMSYDLGALLMRIANRYETIFDETNFPERARSLHDLLYASNQLEMPKGHGEQEFHQTQENVTIAYTRHLMAFISQREKQLGPHPVDSWTPDYARQFAIEIEPIVEYINADYAKAKIRGLDAD